MDKVATVTLMQINDAKRHRAAMLMALLKRGKPCSSLYRGQPKSLPAMAFEVRHLAKRFDGVAALDNVSLRIETGELVALLGPSGSGKTTLLRIVAGLDFPNEGSVSFDGEETGIRDRRVGFVFQHYALFRHLTVFENVAFGLRVKPRRERLSRSDIRDKVMALLRFLQIEQLARRYPAQLSGGQRQRVALARVLAIEPQVLLMDEPFGALDAKVRRELRRWLRHLHERMRLTSLFVTHDQEEALELADRIAIMNRGQIEQVGTPDEVYDRPANPFVYEFLGQTNRFDCLVEAGTVLVAGRALVRAGKALPDGSAIAYVRPHDIAIVSNAGGDGVPAVIHKVIRAGPLVLVELSIDGTERPVEAMVAREKWLALGFGAGQHVLIRARAVRVFSAPPVPSG
jgi:sulfate transport system ATP-binding protein